MKKLLTYVLVGLAVLAMASCTSVLRRDLSQTVLVNQTQGSYGTDTAMTLESPVTINEPVYNIGDHGPAGGLVFYDKGSYADGWRYLEVAVNEIHLAKGVPSADKDADGYLQGKKTFVFGFSRPYGENVEAGTGRKVGSGSQNTALLVSFLGSSAFTSPTTKDTVRTEQYAAKLCDTLSFGGYDDWYLPSEEEAANLVQGLASLGINATEFWTSTEQSELEALSMKSDSASHVSNRNFLLSVRAIRQF